MTKSRHSTSNYLLLGKNTSLLKTIYQAKVRDHPTHHITPHNPPQLAQDSAESITIAIYVCGGGTLRDGRPRRESQVVGNRGGAARGREATC